MLPQLGMPEMLVVMVVAVLLFGKRLPEVGRSLGKGLVEFKKGLRGIEDEFESAAGAPSKRVDETQARAPAEPTYPKFEPPTSAPVPRSDAGPSPYQG
jgi:sec-independent protein translocase protein TatA